MNKELPEEVREKIKNEAAKKYPLAWQIADKAGYYDGATAYALRLQEVEQENKLLREALKIVKDWKLPATGQFWDDDKTRPMSYGACYGSSGERDYMRNVAIEALQRKEGG